MARKKMPIIDNDEDFDKTLAQLGRQRASVWRKKNAITIEGAPLESEIAVQGAKLADIKATGSAAIARLDAQSRVIMAGIARYALTHWGRLHTTTTRIVRSSGVKVTHRQGQESLVAADEPHAVAELERLGLTGYITYAPTINRRALHGHAVRTEDGTGIAITVSDGDGHKVITVTSIQIEEAPGTWEVEFPGQDQKWKVTEEELADLTEGS